MHIDPSQIKLSFDTRAEAQAAWIPSSIQYIMVGALLFQGDSGGDALTTNSGTRGWSPVPWGITPLHWAENATPGTTDMTAALLAAATFADAISDLDTMTYQVKVDLLGQRLAISETDDDGGLVLKGMDGFSIENGELYAIGDWTGTGKSLAKVMDNASDRSRGVFFKNLRLEGNRKAGIIQFDNTQFSGAVDVYGHGFISHGIRATTSNGSLNLTRVQMREFLLGDTGVEDQDNRVAIGFDIDTADGMMTDCHASLCGTALRRPGSGYNFQIVNFHPWTGFATVNEDPSTLLLMDIQSPRNTIISNLYADSGVIKINADDLHSANGQIMSIINAIHVRSAAAISAGPRMILTTSVADNDLAGLIMIGNIFDSASGNIVFETTGSGSWSPNLKWTFLGCQQFDGTPVTYDDGVTSGGLDQSIGGTLRFDQPLVLPVFATGSLPSAASFENGLIFVDDGGAKTLSASDGTDWNAVGGGEGALSGVRSDTLPLGPCPIPGTFNNTLGVSLYWDGTKVQCDVNPYDIIDFEKFDTVNHYYVNYAEGDNANAGTATGSGNSWKTFDYAIANATSPAVIHLEDDLIGYLSCNSDAKAYTGKIKLKGEGASGRTIIAAMRESYDVASFSWSASGSDGAYVSTTASAKQYRSMLDGNYRNAKGIPRAITAAAGRATCETTPSTFFYDSATTDLYVHMFDGRVPDPANGWLYGESPYDFECQQGGDTADHVFLIENCEFISNNGPTNTGAGLRYRPVTTGSETAARFGARNCLVYGGHDNGFEIYDADVVVLDNCHGWYNRTDGANYHSFVTTGTRGEYMTVYEIDCTFRHNGWDGWDDQQSLSASANGTTAHDSIHIMRVNPVAFECNGSVLADVNGCHSLVYNPKLGLPGAGASPKALVWHEKYLGYGTTKVMYVWGADLHDNGDATVSLFNTTAQAGGSANDGEIRVMHYRGQVNGLVVGNVKDWDGNDLAV